MTDYIVVGETEDGRRILKPVATRTVQTVRTVHSPHRKAGSLHIGTVVLLVVLAVLMLPNVFGELSVDYQQIGEQARSAYQPGGYTYTTTNGHDPQNQDGVVIDLVQPFQTVVVPNTEPTPIPTQTPEPIIVVVTATPFPTSQPSHVTVTDETTVIELPIFGSVDLGVELRGDEGLKVRSGHHKCDRAKDREACWAEEGEQDGRSGN